MTSSDPFLRLHAPFSRKYSTDPQKKAVSYNRPRSPTVNLPRPPLGQPSLRGAQGTARRRYRPRYVQTRVTAPAGRTKRAFHAKSGRIATRGEHGWPAGCAAARHAAWACSRGRGARLDAVRSNPAQFRSPRRGEKTGGWSREAGWGRSGQNFEVCVLVCEKVH